MADSNVPDMTQYLREQYKDGANLSARIRLHQRFSTNPKTMTRWILERVEIPADSNVLELGCGTGVLWRGSFEVPRGWRVTLTDMSEGMLHETRGHMRRLGRAFAYVQCDAQQIPFRDGSFDAVIANHMLYHVPDIARALAEVRRVLKPSGSCYAATMGNNNMREMDDLAARFFSFPRMSGAAAKFGLESGDPYMRGAFSEVKLERYPDELAITEAQPLIDYFCSTRARRRMSDAQIEALRNHLEREIAAHGEIRMKKDSGMFIARP